MKLNFDIQNKTQPDPFIFENSGKFYLYVTANDGVEAYSSDTPFGLWHYEGIVFSVDGRNGYWAPSIIKIGDWFYLYVSCMDRRLIQCLFAARAKEPLGPFKEEKRLFDKFTIDSHVVETQAGLFLWYSSNMWAPEERENANRIGTRIYVDRLINPYTPECKPSEAVFPTFDEEKYNQKGWHTIEGAFWFEKDGWQYVMYSGGNYHNDTYHIGYSTAQTAEQDLTKITYVKHTNDGSFAPLMSKNENEEGCGHNSVLKYNNEYYAVYHAREYLDTPADDGSLERRTARICKMNVENGIITVEK